MINASSRPLVIQNFGIYKYISWLEEKTCIDDGINIPFHSK